MIPKCLGQTIVTRSYFGIFTGFCLVSQNSMCGNYKKLKKTMTRYQCRSYAAFVKVPVLNFILVKSAVVLFYVNIFFNQSPPLGRKEKL